MTTLSRPGGRPAALLYAGSFLLALAALLLFPGSVRTSAAQGISSCLTVLAPSLFPFMALASFAVNSPAARVLGKPLGPLVRWGFRLPECCGAVILMSFLGGYPAGARGVSLLLEKGEITPAQAGRMLLFCVNPGPAFVVSFVGAGMLGSPRLGWLLFLAVTAAGLLLGLITALPAPVPEKSSPRDNRPDTAGALMRSVTDAARSILVMSACVVLFSVLTGLLHECGIFPAAVRLLSRLRLFSPMEWAAGLSFLLEVTGGVGDGVRLGAAPVFFAFGLGFGGLCVHMQVLAFFPKAPGRLGWFFLCRFAHGLLSAGIFLGALALAPSGMVEAAAPLAGQAAPFAGTWMGGGSLLLMSAAFLLAVSQGQESPSGLK